MAKEDRKEEKLKALDAALGPDREAVMARVQ